MSRNTLLFLAALIAVAVGLAVSYLPPKENAVAIWSLVSMFFGYGIRDLFAAREDKSVNVTPVTQPVVSIPPIPKVVEEVTQTPNA